MRGFAFLICLLAVAFWARADQARAVPGQFRLYIGDQVRVTVQGEPDMTVDRRIDGNGEINVPLLGLVNIAGMTSTEAQESIAARYIKDEIFNHPEVVFTIVAYATKEVSILGQIAKPGKVPFATETTALSIVDAIASAGGLTRIAKGDAVRVTRHDGRRREQTFIVDVEKLIQGKGKSDEDFLLLPGDIVYVPERVF